MVVAVRDAASTLGECLDSVLAQRFRDLELLVVDDGSRDASHAIAVSRRARDGRVRVLRRPRQGFVTALQAGLRAAHGRLVARLDADDRMHPERLARQHRFLATHPGVDLVASRVRAFPGAAVGPGMAEYLRWQDGCVTARDIEDEIYVEAPFAHPSVTFRRDAVLALGGYRDGPFPEDYDLWLRMARAGRRMAKLRRRLTDWRQRPGSLSRTDPRYAREAFDRLRCDHLSRDPRLAAGRDLVYWGAGRRTRQRSRRLLGLGFAPRAWIDIDPAKIGRRIAGAPVLAPAALGAPAWRRRRPFVLGYVASHGARDAIAAHLRALGYRRGEDYLMVG